MKDPGEAKSGPGAHAQNLAMNEERSMSKLPLCPSCAQRMRLIRRTERFDGLLDVCTFQCRDCGVSQIEEHAPLTPTKGAKDLKS
jgi:hypothetical protein